MDSLLSNKPRLVYYDELFMFNKSSKILKLNVVNTIPEHLIEIIRKKYNNYIRKCLVIKSSKSLKQTKKTHKHGTFKFKRNNNKQKKGKYQRKYTNKKYQRKKQYN